MATVTGLTAERMLEIEGESIVDGEIDSNGHLILTKFDGTTIDAGMVQGPQGIPGDPGPPGMAGISSIPGEVKLWPNTILPDLATYGKWVWADGAIYAVATYPIAAGHIHANWKTAYGQSDPGAGNFRVPDLRGLVPAGLDQMPGGARANRMTRAVAITIVGKTGEETHVVTVAEMPQHNHGGGVHGHTGSGGNHSHIYGTENASLQPGGTPYRIVGSGAVKDHSTDPASSTITVNNSAAIIQNQGNGTGHENVQPTVFVPYIVRLDG